MSATKVSFISDGLRLTGELHLPAGIGPHPGLCICHGIPAVPYNPDDTGYRDLATRCARDGFATLFFHFRGAGLSEGDFDLPGWTRDLQSAIDYLSGVRAVDPSTLYLMGFSGGAATSLCTAAVDARVSGVVSCASPADFEDLLSETRLADCLARWRDIGIVRDPAFPSNMAAWASGFRQVSPVAHIAAIAPRPILLLHGDADEVVPVAHGFRLFEAAAEPRTLHVLPGGVHRLRVDERAMVLAFEWLRSHVSS